MEFLFDYLGFLAKTATVVIAVLIVISAIAAAGAHRAMRHRPEGHIQVVQLNGLLKDMRCAIDEATLPQGALKKRRRREAKARKRHLKESKENAGRRVFVVSFNGDVAANAVEALRREITAVLGAASNNDEVMVRLESTGGTVHGYGLGASQLARVRDHGVKLTVSVDRVAASGGYMMAAVADRILAAPFAVVGSIGVVAQIPNIHRLLKKNDVDVEVLTAGRHKRTLDVLGENTEQGRAKFREELDDIHALFQEFVGNWRPALDMEAVSTGEAWYGQRALDRALVDELITSDEYLAAACDDADVIEVSWVAQKRPIDKFMGRFFETLAGVADRLMDRTMGGFR